MRVPATCGAGVRARLSALRRSTSEIRNEGGKQRLCLLAAPCARLQQQNKDVSGKAKTVQMLLNEGRPAWTMYDPSEQTFYALQQRFEEELKPDEQPLWDCRVSQKKGQVWFQVFDGSWLSDMTGTGRGL